MSAIFALIIHNYNDMLNLNPIYSKCVKSCVLFVTHRFQDDWFFDLFLNNHYCSFLKPLIGEFYLEHMGFKFNKSL